MFARALIGALLFMLIVGVADDNKPALSIESIGTAPKLTTERCTASNGPIILIFNPAHDEQPVGTLFDPGDLRFVKDCQGEETRCRLPSFDSRARYPSVAVFALVGTFHWQRTLEAKNTNVAVFYMSSGSSDVCDEELAGHRLGRVENLIVEPRTGPIQIDISYAQLGPLARNKFIASECDGVAGCFPQFLGRAPNSVSGQSQEECYESDKESLIVINKIHGCRAKSHKSATDWTALYILIYCSISFVDGWKFGARWGTWVINI